MAITSQSFSDGQTLTAAKLNTMHSNIVEAAKQGQPFNYLDNSSFGTYFVINQRHPDATTYTGTSGSETFVFDRWKTSGTYCSYSWTGATLTITNNDSTYARGMYQYIDNARYRLGGRTLTVHMGTAAGNVTGKTTLPSNSTMPTEGTFYTIASPSGNKAGVRLYVSTDWRVYLQITVAPSQTVQIYHIGLYWGDYTNSIYTNVYKGYATELNECRRYFYKSSIMLTHGLPGKNTAPGWQYPVTMRAVPTLTFYDLNDTKDRITIYGTNESVTASPVANRKDGFARIQLSSGTFGTASGAFMSFEASAEI